LRPNDEPAGMPDDRTTVTRLPDRARYDAESIASILDTGFVCHIGFVVENEPVVLPTIYARVGDAVYIHGSTLARWLSNIDGADVCFSVTLVDGIVFARSAFHHSLNYRSVVAFGRALTVTDPYERRSVLKAVVEAVQPGRWDDSRQPSEGELRATTICVYRWIARPRRFAAVRRETRARITSCRTGPAWCRSRSDAAFRFRIQSYGTEFPSPRIYRPTYSDERRYHFTTATIPQTASTTPNGHVPASQP
jgi:nitroimidazol reductase NimA-like FMN-containing flavoprotein (pyridoxamine 5'-phosphate oxidase superfamily)